MRLGRAACMRLGRGGGDPPSNGNTPERGGGDPPLDVNTPEREGETLHRIFNTLVERTHSHQHNDLGEVITPCRVNLMLVWMTYL